VTANLGILQLSEYTDRLDTESSSGYTDSIGETLKEIKAVGSKLGEVAQIFFLVETFMSSNYLNLYLPGGTHAHPAHRR
jgi:hypothetical protein